MPTQMASIPVDKIFDVVSIPCSVKHALILQRWEKLPLGDFFILKNDHDPIPLRYQFQAEYPNQFEWTYLEKGPSLFAVKITRVKAA